MNRREALGTIGAGLGSLLLPTWLFGRTPVVPLQEFCATERLHYRDMRYPFIQEGRDGLYGYATCSRICLRVSADQAKGEPIGNRPPAANVLPWQHRDLRGWKPWPKHCRNRPDLGNHSRKNDATHNRGRHQRILRFQLAAGKIKTKAERKPKK